MATECVRALANAADYPVLMVPHVVRVPGNDYDFLEMVRTKSGIAQDRLAVAPQNLSAAESRWVISKTRAFAGARTHSTIAALGEGVPTVSIGYSMKSRGINLDVFGHLDHLIPANELTPESLATKMSGILARADEIRDGLARTIPVMNQRAYSAGDYLQECLCQGKEVTEVAHGS